jgi:hypothetical protein
MSIFTRRGCYFIEMEFRFVRVNKYDMDLNLFTNGNGETAFMGTLMLMIDHFSIDFQVKAVGIGVKGCIRFLLVIMIIIKDRVVIFAATAHKWEHCDETE